jgi:hypothetical protein
MMRSKIVLLGFLILSNIVGLSFSAMGAETASSARNVDPDTGEIRVPADYRAWPTLGVWSVGDANDSVENREYHWVYTQPETIAYYREHLRFPDGAVLVKELLNTRTLPMTTGTAVTHPTKVKGWFVLVRDTQGRFRESTLWGDGWGWSYFEADDPLKTVSKNYREDCIACHLPARNMAHGDANDADKWIYTFGYPVLQERAAPE